MEEEREGEGKGKGEGVEEGGRVGGGWGGHGVGKRVERGWREWRRVENGGEWRISWDGLEDLVGWVGALWGGQSTAREENAVKVQNSSRWLGLRT